MTKELTVIDTTRKLGITLDGTYRLIYSGRLAARKDGRRWFIDGESVEARIKARNERDSRHAGSK